MSDMDERAYWDPFTEIRAVTHPHGPTCTGHPLTWMAGRWEDRCWLNVPGPFYGADTDNAGAGRVEAPEHVLEEVGATWQEFVYRQPRNVAELIRVTEAAGVDPFGGYGCDGDDHWTSATVREWWRARGHVREWLLAAAANTAEIERARDARLATDLRAYRDYLDGDLEWHLRGYVFFLQERRVPSMGDPLPAL